MSDEMTDAVMPQCRTANKTAELQNCRTGNEVVSPATGTWDRSGLPHCLSVPLSINLNQS